MKRTLSVLYAIIMVFGMAVIAGAIPQTVNFADYPYYTPSQDDMDAVASDWFYTNYGITFDHLYMYSDSRDTFDGLGLSVGWVSENYDTNITGTIFFADTTDYVTLDYWVISDTATYSIFNGADELLDSFNSGVEEGAIMTLSGTGISYLTINGTGGYAQISTLSYDYDGITDGHNDDTDDIVDPVPEPATLVLLCTGLVGFVGASRKKFKK